MFKKDYFLRKPPRIVADIYRNIREKVTMNANINPIFVFGKVPPNSFYLSQERLCNDYPCSKQKLLQTDLQSRELQSKHDP